MKMYYEKDADVNLIKEKKVACRSTKGVPLTG